MPQLILSTCGTSLLTNVAGEQRGLITRYANTKAAQDVPENDRQALETIIKRATEKLQQDPLTEQKIGSAEINGIACYYQDQLQASQDTHWLLATDTWLGTATAEAIRTALEQAGHVVEVKRITDLRTNNLEEFRSAMSELARLCTQEIDGLRQGGWRVIFNLTGGFKSVQGFMQALGMLYADENIYVFERTNELLRLPKLPVALDMAALLRAHSGVFRRIAAGLPVPSNAVSDVPSSLMMEMDGEATFSVWGEVIWQAESRALLQERLWPPIDSRLRFSAAFEKAAQTCEPDRLRMINERLAQLARHLNNPEYNPPSLDFKKLKGKHAPWTHECDAWADRDAKRLFGHFEESVFVIDELAKGLH